MDIFDIIEKRKVQEALKNQGNQRNIFIDYLSGPTWTPSDIEKLIPEGLLEEEFKKLCFMSDFLHTRSIVKSTNEFLEILNHPELKGYRDLVVECGFDFVEKIRGKGVKLVSDELSKKRAFALAQTQSNRFLTFIATHTPTILRYRPIVPLKNVKPHEMKLLSVMMNFLKENPDVTQKEFVQMLQNSRLSTYKELVESYGSDDFVEEIKDHGMGYIAIRINSKRENAKSLDI